MTAWAKPSWSSLGPRFDETECSPFDSHDPTGLRSDRRPSARPSLLEAGHTIALGNQRTLRVVETRFVDDELVLVVEQA